MGEVGSILLVEYDPASLWFNASITITAGWLRSGGRVDYNTMAQPPDEIRGQLRQLGVEPENLEREEKLTITDWYTATLGQKSKEKYSQQSLKIADLSIKLAQTHLKGLPQPDMLILGDDESTFARFNDEKAWIELELNRIFPGYRSRKAIGIEEIMRGIHSEWAYKMLEGSSDYRF
jgi:hypothetical protein